MAVMTLEAPPPASTPIRLSFGRPLTVDDLEEMPDDGHRYELLDGSLLVSPAPGWRHQEVALALATVLKTACPRDMRVVIAPFAVRLTADTEFQPDVLVTFFEDLTSKNLPVPPLLAVEVRSPSTALVDLNLKKAAYQRHRVSSYWLVDPDRDAPTLTALELDDFGHYVEVAAVSGKQKFHAKRPFPVTVVPAELAAGLHSS